MTEISSRAGHRVRRIEIAVNLAMRSAQPARLAMRARMAGVVADPAQHECLLMDVVALNTACQTR